MHPTLELIDTRKAVVASLESRLAANVDLFETVPADKLTQQWALLRGVYEAYEAVCAALEVSPKPLVEFLEEQA